MIWLWLVLAVLAGAGAGAWLTVRRLPVIIAAMSDAARERLLDQVEAVERGRTD